MMNYTEALTILMQDIVARVPTLSFIDIARRARLRAVRALACRRRVRHVPLPEPSAERARLLLLARPRQRPHHAPVRMVRHQVAGRHGRHAADEVPDVVRAAALLRSVARALAQGALLSRTPSPGWPSSTRSCTSSITSIPITWASGASSARTAPTRPTATARASSKQVSAMVQTYLDSKPDPEVYDFLRHDFAALESRHGGVVGTSFRTFPSFPQRYIERLAEQLPSESDAAARQDRTAARGRSSRRTTPKTICTCGSSRTACRSASSARASSGRRSGRRSGFTDLQVAEVGLRRSGVRRGSATTSSWR